jgi:hypothetical protein
MRLPQLNDIGQMSLQMAQSLEMIEISDQNNFEKQKEGWFVPAKAHRKDTKRACQSSFVT